LLCDRDTGRPQATFDGSALTSLRTPAASGVATEVLAQSDVTSLGIFGTGVQAQGHIDAMLSVRPNIETIFVCGRTFEASIKFADTANGHGREILAASAKDTAEADVLCGCTSATTPVIPTSSVRNGTHINLVGSYSAARREVDIDLVAASSIFVDEREAAENEAGELIHADASNQWCFDSILGDLSDLCLGKIGRSSKEEITLFKSVGLAVEDVVIAATVLAAHTN
jgi:ornithine cyclodeaminase